MLFRSAGGPSYGPVGHAEAVEIAEGGHGTGQQLSEQRGCGLKAHAGVPSVALAAAGGRAAAAVAADPPRTAGREGSLGSTSATRRRMALRQESRAAPSPNISRVLDLKLEKGRSWHDISKEFF